MRKYFVIIIDDVTGEAYPLELMLHTLDLAERFAEIMIKCFRREKKLKFLHAIISGTENE